MSTLEHKKARNREGYQYDGVKSPRRHLLTVHPRPSTTSLVGGTVGATVREVLVDGLAFDGRHYFRRRAGRKHRLIGDAHLIRCLWCTENIVALRMFGIFTHTTGFSGIGTPLTTFWAKRFVLFTLFTRFTRFTRFTPPFTRPSLLHCPIPPALAPLRYQWYAV